MYIIKGFFEYPSLTDNSKDSIAVLGELSDNSATFAKDKTIYSKLDKPGVSYVGFHSVRNNVPTVVTYDIQDLLLNIGNYILERSLDDTIGSSATDFRRLLLAEFNADVSELSSGRQLYNDAIWMPEWIEFSYSKAGEHNRIKVWLADESFAGQYDEFIIEVIHPILPHDDFFKNPALVSAALKEYDFVTKLQEAQELRREYPYTYLQALTFEYVAPNMPGLNTKATWIVIIYGASGNVRDTIKETIYSEILKESAKSRDDWEEILPELFETASEFIFTPFWTQYSVNQSDHRAGIYSPTVDYRKWLPIIRNSIKGTSYTGNYVNGNFEISANIYKSLAFAVVGSPRNHSGTNSFSKLFKDYIIVTNDSPDVNRIHPDTVEWMNLFSTLLVAAETMSPHSSVPIGISRIVREEIVYAAALYKNINYLVVSKYSIEALDSTI